MQSNLKLLGLVTVLALSLLLVLSGCNKAEKQSASKMEGEKEHSTHKTQMVGGSGMSAAGLAYVNTADTLYHCAHHPHYVTDKPGKCHECGMDLTMMGEDEVTALRDSHPKGCPMCNIVVPGDSEMTKCERCGMMLVEIPSGDHAMHDH